jgi:hypothetical protein
MQIAEIEGFDVRFIARDGSDSTGRRIQDYDYQRAAREGWTVAKWREKRFLALYPEFDVEVLNGSGVVVHGKTLLSTVRDTYADVDVEAGPHEEVARVGEEVVKRGASPEPREAPGSATPPQRPAVPPERPSSSTGTLTISELESRLWAAANSLRGPVDPADFKA